MEFIIAFVEHLFKYQILFTFLYFVGRSSTLVFSNLINKNIKLPEKIFNVNVKIVYPLIGIVMFGNFLVIVNFFIPLNSPFVILFSILIILPNFKKVNINYLSFTNLSNWFYYLVIPSILLFSTFDILFHYDSGYYHLNNQNWLAESNMVIGFVNIFWAFGMSSIYEYLSAFLWIDSSLIYLHFLNLFFIHFIYTFFSESILFLKDNFLKNASIFLIIFSLLDNFGFGGGRNGFFYIESMGKQDNAVGILILFLVLTIFNYIIKKDISRLDLLLLPIICIFAVQIKISAALVGYLYIFFMYIIIKSENFNIRNILVLKIPATIISFVWIIKNYLQTGCLIFPISFTCKNNFKWFIEGSSSDFQAITVNSSYSIFRFSSFSEWLTIFDQVGNLRNIYLNFLISLLLIYVLKRIFFEKVKTTKEIFILVLSFCLLYLIYLLLYGIIPRYSIGLLVSIIGFISITTGNLKINLNQFTLYLIIFISVVLIVRIDSYLYAFGNEKPKYQNFDASNAVQYKRFNENWVVPIQGDQCWINIDCSMAESNIELIDNGFFKTAFKEN